MADLRRFLIALACAATFGCRSSSQHTSKVEPPSPVVSRVDSAEDWNPLDADVTRQIETREEPHANSDVQLAAAEESQSPAGNDDPAVAEQSAQADNISLEDAIGRALAQNPDLVAQREADAVGRAQLGVAQTYPFNPYVQVQATPLQEAEQGGPGTTYHYVLLMQTIQCAHQQRYREESAAAALNSIRWNIHQAELLNVAQTERLYFTALYLRGVRDLANATAANNDQLLLTLEKQLAAGNATGADVAIVRLDAASTRRQARLADANYLTSVREFRRHLGMSIDATFEPPGDLRDYKWRLPDEASLAIALPANMPESPGENLERSIVQISMSRPDVMAAQCDASTARGALNLATASKTPDLQVGPYYQRTSDGMTFLGFRAQMDIPVINSGAPLERQRYAEYRQRLTIWQQLKTRASLEAQAAFQRYEVALQAVELNETSNRNVPDELTKLERQFRAGEIDILRVIQSRTSLIQNQRALLDFLNETAQAAANLTAAAGVPPESLVRKAENAPLPPTP